MDPSQFRSYFHPATLSRRFIDGFPALLISFWAFTFAFGGTTLPIPYEPAWQTAAGLMGVANLIAGFWPYTKYTRFVAGTISVILTWLLGSYLFEQYIRETAVGQRLSLFSITGYFLIAVFIAWTFGRTPRTVWTAKLDEIEEEVCGCCPGCEGVECDGLCCDYCQRNGLEC